MPSPDHAPSQGRASSPARSDLEKLRRPTSLSRTLRLFAPLLLASFLFAACGDKDAPSDYQIPDSTTVTEALKGEIDAALLEKGEALYRKKGCFGCHMIDGQTRMVGPNLAGISARMDDPTLEAWIRHPKRLKPTTSMPPFDGSDDQLIALMAWLKSI